MGRSTANKYIFNGWPTGFPRALENLESQKKSSMHGKFMEFEKTPKKTWKNHGICEIICVFDCLFSGYW